MKIAPVLLKYSYGKKDFGYSLDFKGSYVAFQQIAKDVIPFWLDDYLEARERLHHDLLKFVERERPDVICFCLMRDEVDIKTLDVLKARCVTLNWFADDIWRFDSFSRQYAPHFTHAVTTNKFAFDKYRQAGITNVILSQWAAYDTLKDFDAQEVDYRHEITFVGAYRGYRDWLTRQLRKEDFEVECFGQGWPNGVVTFEEMQEIFRTSRINLNMSNSVPYDVRCLMSSPRALRQFIGSLVKKEPKTEEDIKARNFEIPSFGGFQLTHYVPGLEDYFQIGREIAVYTNLNDLVLQLQFYNSHDKWRKDIAQNGYVRIRQGHMYKDRYQDVFQQMGFKI